MRKSKILFPAIMIATTALFPYGCGNGEGELTPHELQYPPPEQHEPQNFQTLPQPHVDMPDSN